MNEAVIVAMSGLASFIGSYMALKVHVQYLRRDVDNAVERIEFLEQNYRKVRNYV